MNFGWKAVKLDCIIVTKILRCFRTSGCRKSRNRFKNKKFVVLAEYFEQQANCSRYRIKMSQSRRSPSNRGGISCIYISLANQWKPCHRAIKSWPRILRMAPEKYCWSQWICKQPLQIEERNRMANCDIYFPIFSETIHTILKIFSQM